MKHIATIILSLALAFAVGCGGAAKDERKYRLGSNGAFSKGEPTVKDGFVVYRDWESGEMIALPGPNSWRLADEKPSRKLGIVVDSK